MRILHVLDGLEFNERRPHAKPLAPGNVGHAVCFTLRSGQSLRAHDALRSLVYLFVLKGEGIFSNATSSQRVRACALVVIEPGETYSVRAAGDLVFVAVRDDGPVAPAHSEAELASTPA
jgi:quercetin dioxygenase-like cupin family protein